MKSILSLLLALAMLVSCVAFAEGNTLTGTAMGMKHPITVEVDMDGETIADVRVVECEDTATIRDAAIESVPQRIVEQQNIEVDVVAGATMTSFGIRNASNRTRYRPEDAQTAKPLLEPCQLRIFWPFGDRRQKGSMPVNRKAGLVLKAIIE